MARVQTLTLGLAALLLCPLSAQADGFGFRTPSGNIYCNGFVSGGGGIDCVIVNREAGSAPAAIGTCPAGREFEVSLDATGPARPSCGKNSGALSTYGDQATYGASGQFGDITCTSERTGLTCRNPEGRGFFLSRRKQEVF